MQQGPNLGQTLLKYQKIPIWQTIPQSRKETNQNMVVILFRNLHHIEKTLVEINLCPMQFWSLFSWRALQTIDFDLYWSFSVRQYLPNTVVVELVLVFSWRLSVFSKLAPEQEAKQSPKGQLDVAQAS